jgi:hypothetical protein
VVVWSAPAPARYSVAPSAGMGPLSTPPMHADKQFCPRQLTNGPSAFAQFMSIFDWHPMMQF